MKKNLQEQINFLITQTSRQNEVIFSLKAEVVNLKTEMLALKKGTIIKNNTVEQLEESAKGDTTDFLK